MAGCGRKKCEGTNFNCMTGELLCNENGVSGPSCSDGSPILHIEHNASSCKPNHQFNRESEPCNLSPCPEGKQLNIFAWLYAINKHFKNQLEISEIIESEVGNPLKK